jgi:hypothetical protein
VTLTCTCGKTWTLTPDGRWRHAFIYGHAPSVGGKSERKEGS